MQKQIERHIYRILISLALFMIVLGTFVYHFSEKLSWLNSYYFSVVTLTTVGYGDIVPHTPFGKIFTTFYIMFGVGIITTFITFTARRQGSRMYDRQENHNAKSKVTPRKTKA